MARSTVHYADNATNNILKRLHRKLRPAGTPVQRVEYIIELLLLRIFEVKLKQDPEFTPLRKMFIGKNDDLLFSSLASIANEKILEKLNTRFFPFYASILSSARKVLKGNPSDKIRDQLVLIEEVFSNSNFSNNVTSGNLGEIIGLVNDLDEDRLMKTDLLGDAIESALSETGGTRDIGLHRTPDHIRQFMVALVVPSFNDTIFDPTAGTAGFLFDSFEFVMQTVKTNGKWPGEKTHKELAEWFKKYFINHERRMPTIEVSTDFYRQGVMGIEYLGMIRKMAAINLYIRGLNPGNIFQGDSLAKFKRDFHPESKSVILTNPPFGAERDQDAYPDVWSEYPKESETTILFVKLILETLEKKGRCAVIVSEGFMTWDQNSARALRKSLLEDANLKAIISLPQGVFVSKNGAGPKTSILYFEKGTPTKQVWYYKVTNDGYTMGTNRKNIPGCQLIEALDLFHKYVREGEMPPESRHSFSIPTEWIKTLDPRIKDKIRIEAREELTIKYQEERAKLETKLNEQIVSKKLTSKAREERLNQLIHIWEGKIHNEIARRIEREHLYSFNLPNYRSNLSPEQREEWAKLTNGTLQEPRSPLDIHYRQLQNSSTNELPKLLARLNPTNSLELDIAREILAKKKPEEIKANSKLNKLSEILASRKKHEKVKLNELIEPKYNRITKEKYDGSIPIIDKISFDDGQIHFREKRETGMDLYVAEEGELVTSKINVHQGAVALASMRLTASTHYQIYQFLEADIDHKYLVFILRSPQFLSLLNEQKNKGIKNEQGADFFLEFEIPLPPIEEQEAIVAEIERNKNIIKGAEMVLENYFPLIDQSSYKLETIGSFCSLEYGDALKETIRNEGEYPVVGAGAIIGYHDNYLVEGPAIVIGRRGATSGGVLWIEKSCFPIDTSFYVGKYDETKTLKRYLYYALKNARLESLQNGGAMPGVNRTDIYNTKIPIPTIEEQSEIIKRLDTELNSVVGIEKIATNAKDKIARILNNIWEN